MKKIGWELYKYGGLAFRRVNLTCWDWRSSPLSLLSYKNRYSVPLFFRNFSVPSPFLSRIILLAAYQPFILLPQCSGSPPILFLSISGFLFQTFSSMTIRIPTLDTTCSVPDASPNYHLFMRLGLHRYYIFLHQLVSWRYSAWYGFVFKNLCVENWRLFIFFGRYCLCTES